MMERITEMHNLKHVSVNSALCTMARLEFLATEMTKREMELMFHANKTRRLKAQSILQ
jgi:hypothetical protein